MVHTVARRPLYPSDAMPKLPVASASIANHMQVLHVFKHAGHTAGLPLQQEAWQSTQVQQQVDHTFC